MNEDELIADRKATWDGAPPLSASERVRVDAFGLLGSEERQEPAGGDAERSAGAGACGETPEAQAGAQRSDVAAIRARAEAVRDIRRRKYSAQGISAIDQDRMQRIVVGYAEDVLALLDALDEAERENGRLTRNLENSELPCDGGCDYNSGPEETCSAHGRPVSEVWEIVQGIAAERDEWRARALAAEARNAAALQILRSESIPVGVTEATHRAILINEARAALLSPVSLPESEQSGDDRG